MTDRFAIVILAAGRSSRLGQPKQLLRYQGKTLVEHAASTALASGAHEVVVVVGAESERVRAVLSSLPIRIVENPDWQEGMGVSIRCGVASLLPDSGCVVIALCDQPKITADHLRHLVESCLESGSAIAASSYAGTLGAPCAFARSMFPNLLALQGDAGARDLIRNSQNQVAVVEFDAGNLDVDTPQDAVNLGG